MISRRTRLAMSLFVILVVVLSLLPNPPALIAVPIAYAANSPLEFTWSASQISYTSSVAWGDVDGDGDLDLAVGNYLQNQDHNQIYRNQGGTLVLDTTWNPEPRNTWSVAWGDVDGDGDLDLAVGNWDQVNSVYQQPNQLYRNQGGTLVLDPNWTPAAQSTTSLAWGDVDGDGDLDLVVGNFYEPTQLYRNQNGKLVLDSTPWATAAQHTRSLALGDGDGDGDLDLIVGNWDQPNQLYRNQGGTFILDSTPWATAAQNTVSVAWGDVDNDGDLDLAVGNSKHPNQIYRNQNGGLTLDNTLWFQPVQAQSTRSVVWGDVDGDGDLDLAVGNSDGTASQLYRNQSGTLVLDTTWSPAGGYAVQFAWGDVDGDDDLDLVVGNGGNDPVQLYKNQSTTLIRDPTWSPIPYLTSSLAWGDVDNDGDLDLVIGNGNQQPNQLYRNQGGTLVADATWAPMARYTMSVAWGDVDNDGDLDLAVGNLDQSNQLYRNQGGTLVLDPNWIPAAQSTQSVAWGDVDNDGDLDLAIGNYGQPNQLYRNQNGTLILDSGWVPAAQITKSVAWGDVDNDGDLDLAVGNWKQPNQLYRNQHGILVIDPLWNPTEKLTESLTWGDVDGDGYLDLAVGNYGTSQLYHNQNGTLILDSSWSPTPQATCSLAWGDVDNDGDLDLAVGNTGSNQLYRNQGGTLVLDSAWSPAQRYTNSLAWGDSDGDGHLELAVGNGNQANQLYHMGTNSGRGLPTSPSVIAVRHFASADSYSVARIMDSVVTIPFTLANPDGDPVREVRAEYSLDGGGQWHTAIPAAGTDLRNVAALPGGSNYVFPLDLSASGIFGTSDNVVVRLLALPMLTPTPNSVPVFQYPSASASTFPFRVRGTQVRVVNDRLPAQPMPNAVVFRLNDTLARNQQLIAPSSTASAYTTNALGFLAGRGTLAISDTLIALAPVSLTGSYTSAYSPTVHLYATNIITTPTGIRGFTVVQSGVQTVTVSLAHPLALFDLSVSLEWDARSDTHFVAQLQADLARASELLFQASHGQAALGTVSIFYDRENWDYADLRIYASNRMRPSAMIGGVASLPVTDPDSRSVVYGPGQVRMGAIWNRFGSASGNLSEDWPRTLVHELGHYFFFLEDNYIGLKNGQITAVNTCPGLMGDSYAATWQYQTSAGWSPDCDLTFSNQTTGRADWMTIQTFYPALITPTLPLSTLPPGPLRLPLTLTEISSVDPLTPTARLAVPIFYTVDITGGRVLPTLSARAYLFQHDHGAPSADYTQLISLGRANNDQVLARGALVGDKLCLFEPTAARFGCEIIRAEREFLTLTTQPTWHPDIEVTPTTSVTLEVTVRGVPSGTTGLRADLYPMDDDPQPPAITLRSTGTPGRARSTTPQWTSPQPPAITLNSTGDGVYIGTFTLAYALQGAYIHLQTTDGTTPTWETVTSFALDGNAGVNNRVGGSGRVNNRVGGSGRVNNRVGGSGRVNNRVGGSGAAFTRIGGAPVSSAEGDVLLDGGNLSFALGQFLLLQTTGSLPPLPPWATLIGQGYRFTTSPNAPNLSGSALSFSYLDSEVPAGEEAGIQVYYRSPTATAWTAITTTLDTSFNMASIPTQGPGLYAVMSSLESTLRPGWSNIGYPSQVARQVPNALASADGTYRAVYHYNADRPADPWDLYSPSGPTWLNTSGMCLRFGEGYWVASTRTTTVTLRFRSTLDVDEVTGCAATPAALAEVPPTPQSLGAAGPPATYYGVMTSSAGFTVAAGQPVIARVGSAVCGRGVTQVVDNQVVYRVHVNGATADVPECGLPGRMVSLEVGGATVGSAAWSNDVLHVLDLTSTTVVRTYLPLARR